jgi:hypothetical protein
VFYTRKNARVATNLQQTCSNAVPTTCQQDVFALLAPSLLTSCQRLIDNLLQGCWSQQTCYKLFQQLAIVLQFNNLSTSCEWQPCSNLMKFEITWLLQLVDKFATSMLRTHLVDKLWDFYVCSWETQILLSILPETACVGNTVTIMHFSSANDWVPFLIYNCLICIGKSDALVRLYQTTPLLFFGNPCFLLSIITSREHFTRLEASLSWIKTKGYSLTIHENEASGRVLFQLFSLLGLLHGRELRSDRINHQHINYHPPYFCWTLRFRISALSLISCVVLWPKPYHLWAVEGPHPYIPVNS